MPGGLLPMGFSPELLELMARTFGMNNMPKPPESNMQGGFQNLPWNPNTEPNGMQTMPYNPALDRSPFQNMQAIGTPFDDIPNAGPTMPPMQSAPWGGGPPPVGPMPYNPAAMGGAVGAGMSAGAMNAMSGAGRPPFDWKKLQEILAKGAQGMANPPHQSSGPINMPRPQAGGMQRTVPSLSDMMAQRGAEAGMNPIIQELLKRKQQQMRGGGSWF